MFLALPVRLRQRVKSRLLFVYASITALSLSPALAQQRPFSVKDDIAMMRFNDPSADVNETENDSDNYSPDGKHVAIVTTSGLLGSDQVRSVIEIFDTEAIKKYLSPSSAPKPAPRIVASVAAISQGQQNIPYASTIQDLHWADDSRHIYFRGQNARGGFQLYEARTDGGGFHVLTPKTEDVDRFDVAGDRIVYTATRIDTLPPLPGATINRDAFDVTGLRSFEILFPGRMRSYAVKNFAMFTLRVGAHASSPRPMAGYSVRDNSFFHYLFPFQLSPDGRWLVSAEPVVGKIPKFWEKFDPTPLFEHRRLRVDDPDLTRPDNILRSRRYTLTDLQTGTAKILLDAPSAEYLGHVYEANLVAWSKDQSRVLLTNLYLPPDTTNVGTEVAHTKPCAVVSIDLPTFHRRCLYFEESTAAWNVGNVAHVSFGRTRDEAMVTLKEANGDQETLAFHLMDDTWRFDSKNSRSVQETREQAANHRYNVRVYMKQDLNVPPTLWASNTQTNNARQLWDPNPQLRQLQFGSASVYRWKDSSGHSWIAGLIKPVGYVPGHRYPLVIQMYIFHEHEFLTDGTAPTAFAARHLASAGFVVLQILKQPDVLSGDEDADTSLAGYKSAIERLDADGLIDRERVGVVGFSWTCWYAINALVKAPKLFAAATIADGMDDSYMQYMLGAPSQPNLQAQTKLIRGGNPIGPGLETWVKEAPGFHLDQVETPVRIEAIGPDSILQEWELYGSLYLQHKPVDLIYFPTGTHILQKPLERLESQQGNIDWMRFWLQGYEDPDSSKRAHYERWRRLREGLPIRP